MGEQKQGDSNEGWKTVGCLVALAVIAWDVFEGDGLVTLSLVVLVVIIAYTQRGDETD